jgi:methyl-accepting chemotaxis protein/methyl-accepting chemotaxis protein-1 (serine sensor receptor)
MTIRERIIFTCAALVTSSALLAVVSYRAINSTGVNLQTLATDALPGVQYALSSDALLLEFRGNCWKHIASSDPQAMAAIEQASAEIKGKLAESLKGYEDSIHQPEDREQFEKLRPALERYFQAWEEVLPLSRAAKNADATAKYIQVADPAYAQVRALLRTIVQWNVDYATNKASTGRASVKSARTLTILLAAATLLFGIGMATYLVKGLTSSLRSITSQLSQNANQVAGAASQVASSSQVLAQSASQQAASLEETAASTQEVAAHVQKNVETAAELTATMEAAVPITLRLNQSLDSMVQSMGGLNTSSQKIASIVKVINEIAFQTNILALNAAVEAARSGEAGMGFAVVADEVRNLAHRSAQAAQETGGLIEESVRIASESSTKLDALIQASRENSVQAARVKELVGSVAGATQQQANAIRDIARAIPQLEQATQHIAANAEEGASAAEEMTAQSSALKDITHDLAAIMGI